MEKHKAEQIQGISKTAYRMAYFAGIMQIVTAINVLFKAAAFGGIMLVFSAAWFVLGMLIISSSKKMNSPETARSGSKKVLIFSFLGLNIQAPRSFFGSLSSLALMTFPMYLYVLLVIKLSMGGMTRNQALMCSLDVWHSLIHSL